MRRPALQSVDNSRSHASMLTSSVGPNPKLLGIQLQNNLARSADIWTAC